MLQSTSLADQLIVLSDLLSKAQHNTDEINDFFSLNLQRPEDIKQIVSTFARVGEAIAIQTDYLLEMQVLLKELVADP